MTGMAIMALFNMFLQYFHLTYLTPNNYNTGIRRKKLEQYNFQ